MDIQRRRRLPLAVAAALLVLAPAAQADYKVVESFRNTTAPGWTINGTTDRSPDVSGVLTAGKTLDNMLGPIPAGLPPLPTGFERIITSDAVGDGWLRLTTRLQNQVGTALYSGGRFPTNNGVHIEFDYVSWGGVPGMGADGMSFFLYDADAASPMSGNRHGAGLGFCNGAGGYLGIGFDEWGNFSSSQPQGVGANGCTAWGAAVPAPPGRVPGVVINNIVVRGPTSDGNPYVAGVAPPGGQPLDNTGVLVRPANVHRVSVRLLPKGAGTGYRVLVDFGTAGGVMTPLFSTPLDFNYPAPTWMSLGFSASTGDLINFHEIRDVNVTGPADIGVTKTVDVATAPRAGTVTYTVVISNKDINPYDPGNQSPVLEGNDPATIVDTLPSVLGNVSWTCVASAGSSCPAASGTGNINTKAYTLAPAGTLTFTITGTVADEATCGAVVRNTVTAAFDPASDFTDLDESDNTASADFTVSCTQQAALTISKDNGKSSVSSGEQVTYAIRVQNAGPDAANNAVLRDPAPAGMTCSTVTCGDAQGGAVCPAAGNVTIAALQSSGGIVIPTFPANSEMTFQVGCQVD